MVSSVHVKDDTPRHIRSPHTHIRWHCQVSSWAQRRTQNTRQNLAAGRL